MTHNGVVAAGGRLTDWISLGVLASSVPRDAVDEAVAAAGKGAKRAGGELPPHVMGDLGMALALFAGDGYEGVAGRRAGTLRGGGCWGRGGGVAGGGGVPGAGGGWARSRWKSCSGRWRCRWRTWTRPGRFSGRGG